MKKILVILSVPLSIGGNLLAQAFNPAQQQPTVAANFVDATADPLINTVIEVQATTDGGDAAIGMASMQKDLTAVEAAQPGQPVTAEKEGVIARLNNFIFEKNLVQGYDNAKKRMITMGFAFEKCENPAYGSDFILKREMLFKRAILMAKTELIKSIVSQMSAEDQLDVPGSPIADKLNAKREAYETKIDAAEAEVKRLLAEMGDAELIAKKGITLGDRAGAFMDAVIKELDAGYDPGKFDAEKKARYAEAKSHYQTALREKQAVVAEAQALKGQIESTMSSSVSVAAAMPVMGGNVLFGYEYYSRSEKNYGVGIVYGWSKKSEEAARASLMGAKVVVKPRPGAKPIRDWIQTQDLATMVGPRSYIDHEGKRWTIGISARELPSNPSLMNRAIATAGLFARQMTAYALLADVESNEQAKAAMQTVYTGQGSTESAAYESLSQKMSQSFKNRTVKGLSPLVQKTVVHPISGRKMFVVAMRIDPYLAEQAMKIKANSVMLSNQAGAQSARDAALNKQLNQGVVPPGLRPQPASATGPRPPVPGAPGRSPGTVREGGFGQQPSQGQLDDF
jgi:hypothetical protein